MENVEEGSAKPLSTIREEVIVEDVLKEEEKAEIEEDKTKVEEDTDDDKEPPVKPLDEEKSQLAVNTLLNQALSYMIDNGMVEMPDELRTLNVINRDKVVRKVDEEGIGDDVFKEIGKIAGEMGSDKK